MFWFLLLVGGGVVWNIVDSIAAAVFETTIGVVIVSLIALVVGGDIAYGTFITSNLNHWVASHAGLLIEAMLPFTILTITCWVTFTLLVSDPLVAFVVGVVSIIVFAVNFFVIRAFVGLSAQNADGWQNSGIYNQLHIAYGGDLQAGFTNLTFGGMALAMSCLAILCGIMISSVAATWVGKII